MIEESELAKSIRQEEQKKVDEPVDSFDLQNRTPTDIPPPAKQNEDSVVVQAQTRRGELEVMLVHSSSVPPDSASAAQALDTNVIEKAKEASKALMDLIERTAEPARLEELLALNDDLTGLLARSVPQTSKLKGLGVVIDTSIADSVTVSNGHAIDAEDDTTIDEQEPVTPRIDKGKAKAEPEPEVIEPVLSTPFLISESDEDGDGETPPEVPDELEDIVSPTDR